MTTIHKRIPVRVIGLTVALMGLVVSGRLLQAEVPQLINYQGRLTDQNSDPVADGGYEMRFSLYDAESGSTLVWGPEVWSAGSGSEDVMVTGGLFSVLLGTYEPLSPTAFDAPYWLEIEIYNGNSTVWEPFTPRRQLASAPYALRAGNFTGGVDIQANMLFTTGSVGIGTTTPGYDLEVNGDVNYTGTLYSNGSPLSVTGLWTSETGSIHYSSGNVGIGTTAPSALLEVGGSSDGELLVTSSAGRQAVLEADDGGNYIHVGSTSDHNFSIVANDVRRIAVGSTGGAIRFYDDTGNEERMRINADGAVGIGTTTPSHPLEVVGNVEADGFTIDGVPLSPSGSSSWSSTMDGIYYSGGDVGIGCQPEEEVALKVMSSSSSGTAVYVRATNGADLLRVYDDLGNGRIVMDDAYADTRVAISASGTSYFNGGDLGIGTTEPNGRLTVLGGNITLRETDDGNDVIVFESGSSSGAINGYRSGVQSFEINSNHLSDSWIMGDVAIGSMVPSAKLHVDGDAGEDILQLSVSNNAKMVVQEDGDVGIGTTNPGGRLEVKGGAIKATGGLIIETRTSTPSNPVTGRIWLRTDI